MYKSFHLKARSSFATTFPDTNTVACLQERDEEPTGINYARPKIVFAGLGGRLHCPVKTHSLDGTRAADVRSRITGKSL
jgi:hypothetical protein